MGRPDVSADVIVGFDHHSEEFNLNEALQLEALFVRLRRELAGPAAAVVA